jgi:hypothetical protein
MLEELRLVMQLAVGMVFLLSVSSKVMHPKAFARGVADYQLLPDSLAFGIGLLLIPVEIIFAISHLSGWSLAYIAPITLATLFCFAVAVAINVKRGRVLPCHCFGGQHGEKISTRTLVRLAMLIAAEIFVLADPLLFAGDRLTYPQRVGDPALLGLLLICAIFVLVGGRWLLSIPDVLALFRPCPTCGLQWARDRSLQRPQRK